MVRLVRELVKLGTKALVLEPVHRILQQVLRDNLRRDHVRAHSAVEGVVGARHELEHPGGGEVCGEHEHAARLREVRGRRLFEVVLALVALHAQRGRRVMEAQVVVGYGEQLGGGCCYESERESERVWHLVPPVCVALSM